MRIVWFLRPAGLYFPPRRDKITSHEKKHSTKERPRMLEIKHLSYQVEGESGEELGILNASPSP